MAQEGTITVNIYAFGKFYSEINRMYHVPQAGEILMEDYVAQQPDSTYKRMVRTFEVLKVVTCERSWLQGHQINLICQASDDTTSHSVGDYLELIKKSYPKD